MRNNFSFFGWELIRITEYNIKAHKHTDNDFIIIWEAAAQIIFNIQIKYTKPPAAKSTQSGVQMIIRSICFRFAHEHNPACPGLSF